MFIEQTCLWIHARLELYGKRNTTWYVYRCANKSSLCRAPRFRDAFRVQAEAQPPASRRIIPVVTTTRSAGQHNTCMHGMGGCGHLASCTCLLVVKGYATKPHHHTDRSPGRPYYESVAGFPNHMQHLYGSRSSLWSRVPLTYILVQYSTNQYITPAPGIRYSWYQARINIILMCLVRMYQVCNGGGLHANTAVHPHKITMCSPVADSSNRDTE